MNTRYYSVLDAAAIGELGAMLRAGKIAAIPTETVYGLAANALDADAVARIFQAKGRPQDNPLIVHIADMPELRKLFLQITPEIAALAQRFWPGPLTIVARRSAVIPDAVTAGLDTVAVRLPAHAAARAIIRAAGVPLAAPSANLSGSPSPTTAQHVLRDMDGRIDAVADGGACEVGVESTIVDMSERPFRLLRPGGITPEQLREVLGDYVTDRAVTQSIPEGERVRAPGMKYRHYAPRAPLTAVCGEARKSAGYIRSVLFEGCAVLCFDGYESFFGCPSVSYGAETDAGEQARRLYGALRELDALGPAKIFAQCAETGGMGFAVLNRVGKAAGFDVVRV